MAKTASKKTHTLSHGISSDPIKFTIVIALAFLALTFLISEEYVNLTITTPILIATILYRNGVQFDLNQDRVRAYKDLYLFKIGIWRHLSQYDKLRLKRSKTTQTAMGFGFIEHKSSHSSYTVYLTSKSGLKPILLSDVQTLKLAQEHMAKLSLLTGMEAYDHVAKARESAAKAWASGDPRYARGGQR